MVLPSIDEQHFQVSFIKPENDIVNGKSRLEIFVKFVHSQYRLGICLNIPALKLVKYSRKSNQTKGISVKCTLAFVLFKLL